MPIFWPTILVTAVAVCSVCNSTDPYDNAVTCGSAIKLLNTKHNVRLHSHDVKYGTGSGQQSVTGQTRINDVNSHWTVKAPSFGTCARGTPVKCNSVIRLEHLQTTALLHSHLFVSPLSGQQEVSAYGQKGVGDSGDHWIVLCGDDSKMYWNRRDEVRLKHRDTGNFLAASGREYGAPIQGQMEVCAHKSITPETSWRAAEGIFIQPTVAEKTPVDEDN